MPLFEIQGPDGKVYELEAPDQNSAVAAFQQFSGGQPTPAQPEAFHGVEGMTPEAIAEAKRLAGNQVAMQDNALSASSQGANAGLLANFNDEIGAAVNAPFRAGYDALQGNGFDLGRAFNFDLATNREAQDQLREKHPIATTMGEIGGGVALAGNASKVGLSLLNGAKATLPSLVGRGAAEGAIYGAGYGAGAGEGLEDKVLSAAKGGVVGGVTGGVTGAITHGLASRAASKATPSVDQLKQAANNAYQQAENAGVVFTKQGMAKMHGNIVREFAEFGFLPKNQPGAAAALREIGKQSQGNVTLKGLDSLRKAASNSYIPGNKANNALVGKIVSQIDDLIANAGRGDVLMGNPQQGAKALQEARSLWSRVAKSEQVSHILDKAQRRAGTSGSGSNVENTIRQNFDKLLDKPRGFSQAEQAAINKVAQGTPLRNTLRMAGKAAPTGAVSSIPSLLTTGAFGPVGLALPITGTAAKVTSDAMTRSAAKSVEQLIRAGGAKTTPQLSALQRALMLALTRSAEPTVTPALTGRGQRTR